MRIDKYYDIRCDMCLKSRSADLHGGLGMWEQDAKSFRKAIKREGWKFVNGMTLCPICALTKGIEATEDKE